MISLIIRIVKQMINDKRSLALILIVPVLLLSLLYLLLGDSSYVPKIAVNESFPSTILSELKNQDTEIIILESSENTEQLVKNNKVDAFLEINNVGIDIKMLEVNSVKVVKITDVIKKAMTNVNPTGSLTINYIYGQTNGSTFDNLGYMLLGVLSFFFVFLISGISFVRERTTGTMERLMLTPIKRSGVVAGYTLGFGIFAALQSVIIVLYTKYILKMEFVGSVPLVILIMILLAFTAVSMGALVSIFANSEFQVVQFIPVFIVPQIFFSGLIPVDTLPYGLSNLAYIMPVYYGCTALQNVLIKGFGIEKIWRYLLMLLIFIVILFIFNTLALKKYRKL